jgi:Zn-dependent M28 family amino/carboxypeptidase
LLLSNFSAPVSKPLTLAAALLLAAAAVAQPTVPAAPAGAAKVKIKNKRGAAPASATTDYSVPYAASITPDGLKADLSVLASDEYEGRDTGRKGQKMAADYLVKAFASYGLAGPVPGSDNAYLQHFKLNRLNPAASMKIGERTFVINKDYYVLVRDAAALSAPMEPVFVGYGISTAGYADFQVAAPALKGKDLVLLLGEPLTKAGQPLLGQAGQASAYGGPGFTEMTARSPAIFDTKPRSTIRIAPSAAALARVPQEYEHMLDLREQITFADEPAPAGTGPNVFIVSPEMGAALLGTTPAGLAQYKQAVAKAGRPVASPFRPVAMTAVAAKETFTTENVLGYLEGSDKKDEVVVVSAHYDHVGVQNGVVYNGADDDGSGTVSILAMARAFAQAKKDGHGPRRSLLFAAFTGEERGLLGSRYYTNHPVLPLATTVTDLNIDMVGRVDTLHRGQPNYLYLIGANRLSTELNAVSEATNQQYGPLALDYKYNAPNDPEHLYTRSDHYNFAKRGVPVIYYTSGLHADYHQPTDDVDKIDFPTMARRDQLIFHTAWALANRDQRIIVDAK